MKKEVDTLTAVAALRSPSERMVYAASPVLVAALLLGGAWLIHVPAPQVQVEATVGRVALGLAVLDAGSTLDVRPQTGFPPLKVLAAQHLKAMSSDNPALNRKVDAGAAGGVEIKGTVTLNQIKLGAIGGQASINGRQPFLRIEKSGALVLIGVIDFTMTADAVAGAAHVAADFGGAKLDAWTNAAIALVGGSGSLLSLHPASETAVIELPPLQPLTMGFERSLYDDKTGGQVSISTLNRGVLSFAGGARRIEVPAGAVLHLGDLHGTARLRVEANAIQVTYTGRAGTITQALMEGGEARDMRPIVAEWLATDRDVALFWSGLVFLTGLVLSVRRSVG